LTDLKQAKGPYGPLPLIDWMRSMPRHQIDALLDEAGTSHNYVAKRMYTYDYAYSPTFKFRIAVGIDKASRGQCDFRDMLEDTDHIDWEYVREALNHRTRKKRKLNRPEEQMVQAE
jgi:hypothetical protein